ncbi:MAG TPA: cupredoxin domain-containing protein [Candidatus Binatia bacterium]|nr:cupredoxin domain-containing protein [Candidatus Binatia bacterium]
MTRPLALPLLALVLTVGAARAADEPAVALSVAEGGFSPSEIEAPSRSRVRIEVTNRTAVAIEFESFELNRERVVQPGQTVSVWVSGLEPGRYEFFDDFHRERRGTLVVR